MLYSRLRFASRLGCVVVASVVVALATASLPLKAAGLAEGDLPASLTSALVRVELLAQTSGGDQPDAAGWNQRCPNCGNYHDSALDTAFGDERPATSPGYLIAPDRVLTADPLVEDRFVREWRVRLGDEVVPARPIAWAADRPAMLLQLERPLRAGQPLQFAPTDAAPHYTLHPGNEENGWSLWLEPYAAPGWLLQDGRRFRAMPDGALFLDATGRPLAVSMGERLPADADWRAPHGSWNWIDAAGYQARQDKVRAATDALLLQADVKLRALPVRPGEENNHRNRDNNEEALDRPQTAVVIAPRRVAVLTALGPGLTARLESIRLRLPDGAFADATFVGSSEEFGVFVVDPGRDLPMPAAIATTPWETLRDRLLYSMDVRFAGDQRTLHPGHLRLATIKPGYKNRPVPEFARDMDNVFLFDADGNLLGLPVVKRIKAKKNRWDRPSPFTIGAAELTALAGEPTAWADARNVPQTEAESRRLAWLGVDLQPLDNDLALAHGVSDQTENGGHGAIVTHVYPDSPAARADLRPGDVLLRVQPEGAQQPVNIEIERHAFFNQPFPWERYDEINEAYFDRIPSPWAPAETSFNILLKDLGVGTPYRLDYARDGGVASLDLDVEAGPVHYLAAPELARDAFGFRVRELTFETRRFYQLPDDAKALVVSKVEAGGAAAVAGLKPYELITHINDQPVATADAFAAAFDAAPRKHLAVRRMHQNRVVILEAPAATEAAPQ